MMNRRARSTAGMTLFECLMTTAILAVVVNLGLSIFMSSTRLSALTTGALDRVNMVEDVREAFSRTLHEATGVVSELATYKTGDEQLVLSYPPTPESDGWRRYVVFGRIAPSAGLGRLEISEKDGQWRADSFITYPLSVTGLGFTLDTERPLEARMVTLHVDVQTGSRKHSRPPKTYTFAATLRGDAR